MIELHLGDCLNVLRAMPEMSVDAIVTDPPYGLSFMGKKWDYDVPSVEIWKECLRVLKPGGHLLSFAGTRTQHRMAVNIEDAGFEIRDMIAWVYGCLDEATQVATSEGVKHYHKTKIGDTVLCYNTDNGEYSYQPILEIVEYDYADTAYRLIGDFGEQVVSRNHRVIIERDGDEVFELAENLAREQQVRIPILENLSELRQSVYDAQSSASVQEQNLLQGVCKCAYRQGELRRDAAKQAQREDNQLRGMQQEVMETKRMATEGEYSNVQSGMQRQITWAGMEDTRLQGSSELVKGIRASTKGTYDWCQQSVMERRIDISQSQGCLCGSTDSLCPMPSGTAEHGTQRWLRDGASAESCTSYWATFDQNGSSASCQSRCNGQPLGKPNAVSHERGTQGVRAWSGHKTVMVRIEPFRYVGKVWCLRVPTGAFVAVRNGVAFPTGNSGFPKSLDISKQLDKMAGAEREVVGTKVRGDVQKAKTSGSTYATADANKNNKAIFGYGVENITTPATEAARQWNGFGTALKPSLEPVTVARRPIVGTVAENVLKYGTGGINVDGCRVAHNEPIKPMKAQSGGDKVYGQSGRHEDTTELKSNGRWPANLIHDGSDEVVGLFPETTSAASARGGVSGNKVYGKFADATGYECGYNDTGSAARFFYCAKASKADRDEGCEKLEERLAMRYGEKAQGPLPQQTPSKPVLQRNHHPTVKPTALMRYLCRLVTPPGGIVLDPFMGSGSTGKAAVLEGFNFIGIEREPEYMEIARRRIHAVQPMPEPVNDSVTYVQPSLF